MATIFKEGKKWRAQVCVKGVRASRSFATKAEAKLWAADKSIEISGGRSIAASTRRIRDLFERYRKEVSPSKKGAEFEDKRLRSLCTVPLADVLADDLNAGHIAMWRDVRLTQVKSSTVNRELNLISAVFTRAVKEWHWLSRNPISDIQRPKNPRHRDRRITQEECNLLLATLGYTGVVTLKSHLVAVMILFALETGMRIGEICVLRGADVFEHHVVIHDSKNGDLRNVPLSSRAREFVKTMVDSGLTIDPDTAGQLFKRACRRANIEGLHFHDLRHSACTELAKKISVLDLARMIGHRDLKSLMVYYNPTPEEIASRLQ